jgi:hypothetical protein
MAQNHAPSIFSFLDAHYETQEHDLAVSNYGLPLYCSTYQLSYQIGTN